MASSLVESSIRGSREPGDVSALALQLPRPLPSFGDGPSRCRDPRGHPPHDTDDQTRQGDERKLGTADENEPEAGESDEERTRRRKKRSRQLAEHLAHQSRRGVGPERSAPLGADFDEGRGDDRQQQIPGDSAGRDGTRLSAHQWNSQHEQLERKRPGDDADERHQPARDGLADRSDPGRARRRREGRSGARRVASIRRERERQKERDRPQYECGHLVFATVRRRTSTEDSRNARVGGCPRTLTRTLDRGPWSEDRKGHAYVIPHHARAHRTDGQLPETIPIGQRGA